MPLVRRWFLFGGSVFIIFAGFILGVIFMMSTINIFNAAIAQGGNSTYNLVVNLAHGLKGILAWIVFGITMTNALIIASSLSIVSMVRVPESAQVQSQAVRKAA